MSVAAVAALRVGDEFAARGRRWRLADYAGWYWTEGYVEVPAWALFTDGSTSVKRRVRVPLA